MSELAHVGSAVGFFLKIDTLLKWLLGLKRTCSTWLNWREKPRLWAVGKRRVHGNGRIPNSGASRSSKASTEDYKTDVRLLTGLCDPPNRTAVLATGPLELRHTDRHRRA